MKRATLLLCLCLALAACEKAMQDMYDQPKYKPYAASSLFRDGMSARPLPPGSIPASGGAFADTSSGRQGADEVTQDLIARSATHNPYPVTQELLQRGQQRYTIYCVPCHSPAGDGDGLVARRGFPHPPSYHSDRLRAAPDRHFFDVMTNGYGIMRPYADRVSAPDRWAIVAYIRVLQLSQHAAARGLPDELRSQLPSPARGRGAWGRGRGFAEPRSAPPERASHAGVSPGEG